jgi:hypothetical protein
VLARPASLDRGGAENAHGPSSSAGQFAIAWKPTLEQATTSPGQTRANNAIAPLSAAGNLTAYASQPAGTRVHLVIDVSGYFE